MTVELELIDQMVDIDGNRVHVMRKGEGPPLLWLHGSNGCQQWNPFLEALSSHFDVIAPEHPGFGLSERPDWLNDIEDLVYFYRSFLDHFGIEKTYLLGQSIGGWLAAEFAVSQTHRVEKLVLSAAAGLRVENVPRADVFVLTQEELTDVLFFDKKFAEKEKESIRSSEEKRDMFVKNRMTHARLAWERDFNPKLQRHLKWIDIPTLIVWGENDEVISSDYAKYFSERIPNSEIKIIPECGHLPYVEKREEYVAILTDFLK